MDVLLLGFFFCFFFLAVAFRICSRQHIAFLLSPFLLYFVNVHVVHPYSGINTHTHTPIYIYIYIYYCIIFKDKNDNASRLRSTI